MSDRSRSDFMQAAGPKAAYIFLSIADLLLTLYAFRAGFRELNPLLLALQRDLASLVLLKVALPSVIGWLVPPKVLLPAIALLVVVVAWDITQLVTAL